MLAFFLSLEASIESLLAKPKWIPAPLQVYFREYYMVYDRNIIQFMDEAAQYDPDLFYRMQPGSFLFKNREFEVGIDINSKGLRDSESSLEDPEIIILGDSFAFGWGVDADSTFAGIIERSTALRVLNASIPSYGTAREITLLEELDTDSLQFLLIQYCSNDYDENKDFVESGMKLNVSDRSIYNDIVSHHKKSSGYFPFKHIIRFGGVVKATWAAFDNNGQQDTEKVLTASLSEQNKESASEALYNRPNEYINFLKILQNKQALWNPGTQIILFSLDGYNSDSTFISGIRRQSSLPEFSDLQKKITLMDLSELTESTYFLLDDHINNEGHRAVADKLADLINHAD